MATALKCEVCSNPRSRYSTSDLCSLCEKADTDAHVAQCRSDIENNVHITKRLSTVFPNLCMQCYKVLPTTGNKRIDNQRKFCDRHCQYKWRKANGVERNAR